MSAESLSHDFCRSLLSDWRNVSIHKYEKFDGLADSALGVWLQKLSNIHIDYWMDDHIL
jgi:hypothetical protein